MLKKILIGLPIVVIAGAGGALWYANAQAKSIVDARLADMVANGGYDKAEYEDIQIGWNGRVTMTNLNLAQGPLDYTLADITITDYDFENEFPRHMDLTVSGLKVVVNDSASADPQAAAFAATMREFGFDEDVPLLLTYNLRYDPDNAHQTDSAVHMTITDSFTLDATSVTRGVPMHTFGALGNADPLVAQQQMQALLADAELPSARLSLRDQGIVDSMIAMSAQQNGVAPEDFRNLLVSQARNMYLFLPPTAQNLAMTAGNEVAEFLEGGKTLSVSVTPEYGGRVQQLQVDVMGAVLTGDYDKIGELLQFEISAD